MSKNKESKDSGKGKNDSKKYEQAKAEGKGSGAKGGPSNEKANSKSDSSKALNTKKGTSAEKDGTWISIKDEDSSGKSSKESNPLVEAAKRESSKESNPLVEAAKIQGKEISTKEESSSTPSWMKDLYDTVQDGATKKESSKSPKSLLLEGTANDAYEPEVYERTLTDCLKYIEGVSNKTMKDYWAIREREYPIPFENHDQRELLRFTDTIRSKMFAAKLKNYLEPDKIRSWSDILSGEKAYSETIGYRVAKHEIADGKINLKPIQEFYFMDSDEIETINFVDTQITTGKKYLYRIHSINFVVASLYQHEFYGYTERGDKYSEERSYSTDLLTRTVPRYCIIEAPFFERVVSTESKPPVFPQVSFLPYQGIADKIRILIQSNFGQKFEKPMKILDSDQEIIDNMIEAQPHDPEGKIMFENDSLPSSFQIMRLSGAPSSYSDFRWADYIKTIPADGRTLLYKEEDFEPNRNYYYTFREIDDRGISNPSEVFRVKMNSYENGIYMDIEAYEMQPREETTISMSFERALQIMPNLQQRSLRFPGKVDIDSREFALSAPEEVSLGNNMKNSVWGRKFKARIKSKKSGRKIDINFSFLRNVEKRAPEAVSSKSKQDEPCSD